MGKIFRGRKKPSSQSLLVARLRRPQEYPIGRDRRLDVWLQRAAHATQVLLLLLGVFGYFYTVRPIHQKEILDEEIAQKNIELRVKEKEMRSLLDSIKKTQFELSQKESALSEARKETRIAKTEATKNYSELRVQLLGVITDGITQCANPVIDRGLRTEDYTNCSSSVERSGAYHLGKLKSEDRGVLLVEIRGAIQSIKPSFDSLMEKMRLRAEADQKELSKIREKMDLQSAGGATRSSTESFQLVLDQRAIQSRMQQQNFNSYQEYSKLLEGARDRAWDRAYKKFRG
jgi:hypothetical protein